MKETNKNLVLRLLEQDALNNGYGLTTEYVAKELYMQRSNASKLLNELVEEEYVNKTEGVRPVIYSRSSKNFDRSSYDAFKDVVGKDGSLKQAINLAKAAIVYPNKSLYTLLIGSVGSGKKMLTKKMYQYAINMGVLNKSAEYFHFSCLPYADDKERMRTRFIEAFKKTEEGLLYISAFDHMDIECKQLLLSVLENGYLELEGERHNQRTVIVCSLESEKNVDQFCERIIDKFAVRIELPSLERRGLKERFELIKVFFNQQSSKSLNTINASSEILMSLLLYRCNDSIKQLQNDIGLICASAYARQMKTKDRTIRIQVTDLPQNIRNGILNYKSRKDEIDLLLEKDQRFSFTSDNVSVVRTGKAKDKRSIYTWIDEKKKELKKSGLSHEEIDSIVDVGIKEAFQKYQSNLIQGISDKNQIVQIVDPEIAEGVRNLLEETGKRLNRVYSTSVYYGLCLHMQSIVENKNRKASIGADDAATFIKENKTEYDVADKYAGAFEKRYGIALSVAEIILIAMFLCTKPIEDTGHNRPSLLIAMHGNGIAREMAEVAGSLSGVEVYHYDMSLNKRPLDAYEEIKELMKNIPSQNGILVIYDQGSFKDIFSMLSLETGKQIETLEIPLSSFLFDCARKTELAKDARGLYQDILDTYRKAILPEKHKNKRTEAIITFCLTGEGGAEQLKRYIEKNYQLKDVEVIALQLKEQNTFLLEINRICNDRDILCLIGTFKPNIYGIPFIPIEKVFHSNNDLRTLLSNKEKDDASFLEDAETVFETLERELENVDVAFLKEKQLQFIEEIENEGRISLDADQKLGLIIHMMCSISRLAEGRTLAENINKRSLIDNNIHLYRTIEKAAIPIEKAAGIKFDENEIANLISLIKKSRTG